MERRTRLFFSCSSTINFLLQYILMAIVALGGIVFHKDILVSTGILTRLGEGGVQSTGEHVGVVHHNPWKGMAKKKITVNGFIFVGTNFRGFNKNHLFVGFKICGQTIFVHHKYRKLIFHGYWNWWFRHSTKTTKIVPNEN